MRYEIVELNYPEKGKEDKILTLIRLTFTSHNTVLDMVRTYRNQSPGILPARLARYVTDVLPGYLKRELGNIIGQQVHDSLQEMGTKIPVRQRRFYWQNLAQTFINEVEERDAAIAARSVSASGTEPSDVSGDS